MMEVLNLNMKKLFLKLLLRLEENKEMNETIKYELEQAEKLEAIDNIENIESEKKSIGSVMFSLSCCGYMKND